MSVTMAKALTAAFLVLGAGALMCQVIAFRTLSGEKRARLGKRFGIPRKVDYQDERGWKYQRIAYALAVGSVVLLLSQAFLPSS